MKRFLSLLLSGALLAATPGFAGAVEFVTRAVPETVGVEGAVSGAAPAAPGGALRLAAAPSLAASLPASLTLPSASLRTEASAASAFAAPAARAAANAVSDDRPSAAPAAASAKAGVPDVGPGREVSAVQAESAPAAKSAVHEATGRFDETIRRLEPPPGTPRTVAGLDLTAEAGKTYYPSPEDWRDESIYSIMTDRFARSASGRTLGDPKSGTSRHGGDLKGVISKLDYIKASGATAVALSPVAMGIPEAYHGYAPIQLLAVDPYLGTMEDYKTLVSEAHKRGLRVVLDLVMNHTGPVFEYVGGSKFQSQGRKQISEWTELLGPEDMGEKDFTRRGVIDNWNNHDQATHGDFPPNYRHWDTERPETQEKLIRIASWWLKEADVDAIRLDAIRHMDEGFVKRFSREIKAYAATLGKKNVLMLPENSTGVDAEVAQDLALGMDSGYNYPEFRRQQYALHGKGPTRQLEESFKTARDVLGEALGRIVRFIDLHDVYRFLRAGEPEAVLHTAFAFLMFSTGIPLVYYGTEQAFRQNTDRLDPEGPQAPADPQNREDMFPEGQFKSASSAGDKFDVDSPSFKVLARFQQLRKELPALRRGDQFVRWSDPWGPGVYAFSRIYQGQEVLVVMNTADEARSADMFVDSGLSPPGAHLADRLDGAYAAETYAPAGGGSRVIVSVPAHGVRVLVKK